MSQAVFYWTDVEGIQGFDEAPTQPSISVLHFTHQFVQLHITPGQNVAEHTLFRAEMSMAGDPDANGTVIATLSSNTTGFTDNNVDPGTQYFYIIRASNNIDDVDSSEISVTTAQEPEPVDLSADHILFSWDGSLGVGTEPRKGGDLKFERASFANWHDQKGDVRRRTVDSPRLEWERVRDIPTRVAVLEPQTTQYLTHINMLHSIPPWGGSHLGVDGHVIELINIIHPPNPNWRVWRLEDIRTDHRFTWSHTINLEAGIYTFSWYLRKKTSDGPFPVIETRMSENGSSLFPKITVNPVTGEFSFADGAIDAGVIDKKDWWRVWITAEHDNTFEEPYWMIIPTWRESLTGPFLDSLTGHQIVTMPNVTRSRYLAEPIDEDGPVSTARDVWSWNSAPRVTPCILYLDFIFNDIPSGINVGNSYTGLFRLGNLGSSVNDRGLMLILGDTKQVEINHHNGIDSDRVMAWALASGIKGKPIEAAGLLRADGAVRLVLRDPSGSVVGGSWSDPLPSGLPISWGNQTWLNTIGTSDRDSACQYIKAAVIDSSAIKSDMDGSDDEAFIDEVREIARSSNLLLR